jgi:hypothetical protein
MESLIIALPERLTQQAEEQGISQQRLQELVIEVVEAYLLESQKQSDYTGSQGHEKQWMDGKAFAQRVIASNRSLLYELAKV